MSAWIFKNRVVWLVVWVVGMVASDQITKVWAQGALSEERNVVRAVEIPEAKLCTTATGPRNEQDACTDLAFEQRLSADADGAVLSVGLATGSTAELKGGDAGCTVDIDKGTAVATGGAKCDVKAADGDGWGRASVEIPGRDVKVAIKGTAWQPRLEEKQRAHEPARTIEVVPGLFNFKYAENRAAAFSLTQSIPEGARRPMLLLVSLLACALIAAWYMRLKVADGLLMTSFALIIAGALGNFLDRARLGYVVDFLDFWIANDSLGGWLRGTHTFLVWTVRLSDHWPTFNIADSCIVSGAIGVVLRTIRPLPGEKKT